MDITARRLWIIKQILATTDESMLQKIEYLLLTSNSTSTDSKGVKEPTEQYQCEQDYKNLPEKIKEEIAKLALVV